jgi:hypothetical protein
MLGHQPTDPEQRSRWLHHIAVIAAYRDQYQVTSDDPRQVLGPYAEPGNSGHKAYWDAAESVLAARHLAGLKPAVTTRQDTGEARAQVASDIYRALPNDERSAISSAIAADLGVLWFGDPTGSDEEAATHPAYSARLAAILAQRGHLTEKNPSSFRMQADDQRPIEASFTRRRSLWRNSKQAVQTVDGTRLTPLTGIANHDQKSARGSGPTGNGHLRRLL